MNFFPWLIVSWRHSLCFHYFASYAAAIAAVVAVVIFLLWSFSSNWRIMYELCVCTSWRHRSTTLSTYHLTHATNKNENRRNIFTNSLYNSTKSFNFKCSPPQNISINIDNGFLFLIYHFDDYDVRNLTFKHRATHTQTHTRDHDKVIKIHYDDIDKHTVESIQFRTVKIRVIHFVTNWLISASHSA